ncbi:MAG: hypothetical protein QXW70_00195 [Candidatus Anstonellales archaeon]
MILSGCTNYEQRDCMEVVGVDNRINCFSNLAAYAVMMRGNVQEGIDTCKGIFQFRNQYRINDEGEAKRGAILCLLRLAQATRNRRFCDELEPGYFDDENARQQIVLNCLSYVT